MSYTIDRKSTESASRRQCRGHTLSGERFVLRSISGAQQWDSLSLSIIHCAGCRSLALDQQENRR